jgi:hypothetical protein
MAGSVGATMTAHFAKRGNLADVSAKSASLGTVAQLVGTMVRLLTVRGMYFDIDWNVAFTSNEFCTVNMDNFDYPHFPAFGLELQVPLVDI